jgi:acetyl/propionyl-CoA carboxylase alpha subunit
VKTVRLIHRGLAREVRVDRASAALDGRAVSIAVPSEAAGLPRGEIVVDGRRYRIVAARAGDRTWVWCEGRVFEFEAARVSRASHSSTEHAAGLGAPMPGRVRRLVAAPGAAVARGDVLLVLEAMKMEHAIRAPQDGILERFLVAEGDLVEAGVDLAELADAAPRAGG